MINQLDKADTKRLRYFPIKILLGLILFTEFLFVFGPISYNISNLTITIGYLFLNNFMLFLGYKYYVSNLNPHCIIKSDQELQNLVISKKFIIIALLLSPIRIKALWDVNPVSITAIMSHLINSLFSPGDVYSSKLEFQSNIFTYLNMFVNIFVVLALTLGTYYYRSLNKKFKRLVILLILIELSMWIGQGVRKGILDTLLLLFFIIIAQNSIILTNKKYFIRIAGVGIIGGIIFISYFIYSNMSRYGLDDMSVLTENGNMYSTVKDFYEDWNPILLVTLCSIQGYACQGYYALSKALSLPYEFSYFLGSSWFGINVSRRIGIDSFSHTYIGRLEQYGIDSTINWHTIYTWLANDYSFMFVPIFIFFIGFFLAKSWNDTICHKSIFAPATFFYFALMVFYSFANNQVFSLMFIPFVTIFILWSIDRKKKNTTK